MQPLPQERVDRSAPLLQRLAVRRQQDHIVHIAQVLLALQDALDEVVQIVEKDCIPQLADGQSLYSLITALRWCMVKVV